MKKFTILLAAIALFAGIATASAGHDRPISVDQLPAPAQQFLKTHFNGIGVSYAKVDEEMLSKSYDVVLVNGCKVEFLKNGNWKDVDCKYAEVPASIVPGQIKAYVAKNHPGRKITSIDRDKRDYEIELDNGLDLKFDLKFNLIQIDD